MTGERVLVGGGGDGQGGDSGEGPFIIAAILILSVGLCFLCLWCLRLQNAPFKGENNGKKIIARIRKKHFKPAKRMVRVRPVQEIKAQYNPNVGHWGFKTAPVQHSAQVTSLKSATIAGAQLSPMDRKRLRERERVRDDYYARRARGDGSPNNRVVMAIYGGAADGHRLGSSPSANLHFEGRTSRYSLSTLDRGSSKLVKDIYGDLSHKGDTPIAYRV